MKINAGYLWRTCRRPSSRLNIPSIALVRNGVIVGMVRSYGQYTRVPSPTLPNEVSVKVT
ncbi:hypothetical protein CsSME_00014926 [Camellia sinensis var. sinensis]